MDEIELSKKLNQASREQILEHLRGLIKDHSPDLIVDNNPCYLKMNISNTNSTNNDVVNYISALSLMHCLDAWKFIGRAFQSVTSGDSPTACHLAYYAELRAAISILASQGIAIFRDHYTIVKTDGTYEHCQLLGENGIVKGTHEIAWILLGRLCYDTNFTEILSRIICVDDYELNDFLQDFGYANSSLKEFWSKSLSEWGIDLKLMNQERNRRNTASYLPNWFIRKQDSPFKEVVKFSSGIWKNLEYSNESFTNLDRALFKKTLEALRRSKHWTEQDYFMELDKVLKIKGISQNFSLYEYLHKNDNPDFLNQAGNQNPKLFPGYEISMMSRAVLLSRIALGTVKLLLDDCNSLPAGVNNILLEYGTRQGIFDRAFDINMDLYADIEDIIVKADKWYTQTTKATPNDWNLFSKEGANIMTSFERIPILGLSR